MPEDLCPVRWVGSQAVVTLPEHMDRSNADQVSDQLLLVINRGATALIADMTAAISCDYSGAEALVRAYRRAVANGTQLRLVVTADVVRRVLGFSGLDRLVSVYPALDAAVAAGAEHPDGQGGPPKAITPAVADPGGLALVAAEDRADRAEELLDSVVKSIFDVGVILQSALSRPPDLTGERITEALCRLDDVVAEVRQHVFAERDRGSRPGLARGTVRELRERAAVTTKRGAVLNERVAQTASALHRAAIETAALLERRADLLRQPAGIDYPTEIKRWRVLADQAEQIAQRWRQRP